MRRLRNFIIFDSKHEGEILSSRWYVLACTPHKERVIYHLLQDRGFEVSYPYLILRTKSLNTLRIEPYFPGYIFVKVDLLQIALSTFQWMPMTSGLINIAGKPAYVPESIVRAIHQSLKKINSRVLGMPDDLEPADISVGLDGSLPGNGLICNPGSPGSERSQTLMQLLQELTLTPEV